MKLVNVFLSAWIYLIHPSPPPTPKCQTLTFVKFPQKEHVDDKNGLERREENGGMIRYSKSEHGARAVLAGSLWEAVLAGSDFSTWSRLSIKANANIFAVLPAFLVIGWLSRESHYCSGHRTISRERREGSQGQPFPLLSVKQNLLCVALSRGLSWSRGNQNRAHWRTGALHVRSERARLVWPHQENDPRRWLAVLRHSFHHKGFLKLNNATQHDF